MTVGLILSGAYVVPSLAAEVGKLPASFVPLAMERLVYHQIKFLQKFCKKIYLSLPEDYVLEPFDVKKIESLDVSILITDPTVSIGQAVYENFNKICSLETDIVVLFGDTLFKDIFNIPLNSATVHHAKDGYEWAHVGGQSSTTLRQKLAIKSISGLFRFAEPALLMEELLETDFDFVNLMSNYLNSKKLKSVDAGTWYDFGHLQTYYRSVGLITTERSFNSIMFRSSTVIKSSYDKKKMDAEASWYRNLKPELRIYTPAYLGSYEDNEKYSYTIANTFLAPLCSLSVFGNIDPKIWVNILTACKNFLHDCREILPAEKINSNASEYFLLKTTKRLEVLKKTEIGDHLLCATSLNGKAIPSIDEVCTETQRIIEAKNNLHMSLVHGDFCFSNIFYDFRSSDIKVIDPRGLLPNGEKSIFGLHQYDLAKLAHSIYGEYDFIIAGYKFGKILQGEIAFSDDISKTKRNNHIKAVAKEIGLFDSINQQALYSMLVHLFLSMLPLHADNPGRQVAMFATAHQLFKKIDSKL